MARTQPKVKLRRLLIQAVLVVAYIPCSLPQPVHHVPGAARTELRETSASTSARTARPVRFLSPPDKTKPTVLLAAHHVKRKTTSFTRKGNVYQSQNARENMTASGALSRSLSVRVQLAQMVAQIAAQIAAPRLAKIVPQRVVTARQSRQSLKRPGHALF
ncbi:hypothetical protein F5Y17DRAFT_71513 [Xylariaceae sp. FL0594]|nr:hypothetical protein F5Y17DRAFT_71513 [Xylariaceae sp. FL0594]